MSMIELHQVSKQYPGNGKALSGINLSVAKGELVFLTGPSGAGKSTLLKMIAAIERPSTGVVQVNGQDVGRLKSSGLPYLRRKLGLIFQQQRLLFDRNVLSNVTLPLIVTGTAKEDAERRARAALDKVGLLDKALSAPLTLSGGEQQRVAIARAVVANPRIILADEPTGSLDPANSATILRHLSSLHQRGATVILATHDPAVAQIAGRAFRLARGTRDQAA